MDSILLGNFFLSEMVQNNDGGKCVGRKIAWNGTEKWEEKTRDRERQGTS